jgi:vacuolar-type H+-ATPase subunit D/Vma8
MFADVVRLARSARLVLALLIAVTALPFAAGCDRIYYGTMQKFGVEKRDILVKRVREARKSQQEAKEEFQSALDKFRSVIEVEGSPLEDKYNTLNKELERSESRANQVHDRVAAVRDVSKDLFKEWEKELKQYSNPTLRAESQRELNETRRRADKLLEAMTRAEQRIDPVLRPLRDRVLFLKHHLNAQAIGALDKELLVVKSNVDSLVADLERAIAEADAFAQQMDADAKK